MPLGYLLASALLLLRFCFATAPFLLSLMTVFPDMTGGPGGSFAFACAFAFSLLSREFPTASRGHK